MHKGKKGSGYITIPSHTNPGGSGDVSALGRVASGNPNATGKMNYPVKGVSKKK